MINIDSLKIVRAVFVGGMTTVRTKPVYRYDRGRVLVIDGLDLPDAYKVHFSNSPREDAIPVIGTSDGALIPDSLLETGKTLYAWVYVEDEEAGLTLRSITVPVTDKSEEGETPEPTPEQESIIDQAIGALTDGVATVRDIAAAIPVTVQTELEVAKQSGEFDGPKGDPGDDGFSPTASVTKTGDTATITITDKGGTTTATVQDGAKGDPGEQGDPGQDGVSPTVQTAEITGGHRVTITDAEGSHAFDVMDGAEGDPGTPGQDGHTPVRGTDYWTAADKAEIVGDAVAEIADSVVRYDESQQLTEAQKETARENVGAAPDTLADEVNALHGLVDYQPEFGQISGTNYATITRIGDVININGTHGGGIVTGRIVINGALAYANSNTAFAGLEHAGIRLTVGHKYALRLTHISGTAVRLTDAPNAICYPYVYVNGTDNPPTSPTDGNATADAGGYDAAYTFTYDQSLDTNGVLLSVNIKRLQSGTPAFTNYRICVTLEDITDATETHGIPSGGTTGQVLTKASGTDYDATWTTPQGGGVSDVQVNGTSVVTGGVANVPIASLSSFGVAKFSGDYGIGITAAGQVYISSASSSLIKNPTGSYRGYKPIVASLQHESAFYGLAKAAGDSTQSASSNAVGQYTESAKSAIKSMIGIGEWVQVADFTATEAARGFTLTFDRGYHEIFAYIVIKATSGTTSLVFKAINEAGNVVFNNTYGGQFNTTDRTTLVTLNTLPGLTIQEYNTDNASSQMRRSVVANSLPDNAIKSVTVEAYDASIVAPANSTIKIYAR